MTPGKRAVAKIGGSLAAAAATSILVAWLADADSMRRWLLSVAGALELWGVLLVASPELAPYLRRLRGALGALPQRTKALVRRVTDWVRIANATKFTPETGRVEVWLVTLSPEGGARARRDAAALARV